MALQIPIAIIEQAIIQRLKSGLGKMVKSVSSYGGELDESLDQVVRSFPAAWVTFAGVTSTRPKSTSRTKYDASGRFVVLVGTQSVRSEAASRVGGPGKKEVGSYQLIYAVRRLLTNQDLDLAGVDFLQPGAVRTLFNGATRKVAASVFALEFDTSWIEKPLERGRFPAPNVSDVTDPDATDPDLIFVSNQGQLDEPYPDLEGICIEYRLPTTPDTEAPDARDLVNFTIRTDDDN